MNKFKNFFKKDARLIDLLLPFFIFYPLGIYNLFFREDDKRMEWLGVAMIVAGTALLLSFIKDVKRKSE